MASWFPSGIRRALLVLVAGLAIGISAPTLAAEKPALDPAAIGEASGAAPSVAPDGVVRIGWPRTDVAVVVDGTRLDPAAGLGSWAAFLPSGDGAMVMGDTVVFEDEVTPALDAALAAGLAISALHNHFLFADPPVYFMHVEGHGDAAALAAGVRSVWDAIRAVRASHPKPEKGFSGGPPVAGRLDADSVGRVIGNEAVRQGDVVKVTIARRGHAHGAAIGGSMGLTTWAAFSGGDARAAVDGDFIMTSGEVQAVIRALRKANINVVALHNHMLEDEPRFFFLHFWGKAPAMDLAKGVRAALDAQASAANSPGTTR